jgi:hypothetical protein
VQGGVNEGKRQMLTVEHSLANLANSLIKMELLFLSAAKGCAKYESSRPVHATVTLAYRIMVTQESTDF